MTTNKHEQMLDDGDDYNANTIMVIITMIMTMAVMMEITCTLAEKRLTTTTRIMTESSSNINYS